MKIIMRTATTLLACVLSVASVAAVEAPPAPGTPKDFKLPTKTTTTLGNGLRVTYIEYGEIPKVTISAIARVGNVNEGDKTWLADLTAEMMKEGAGDLNSEQVAQKAAGMGGSVAVGVGPDESTVAMDVLSENAAEAMALVADVIRRPRLPESEFERVKRNFDRQLALAKAQPQTLASEAFLAALYPNHPYGRVLATEAQLASYTMQDVRDFHSRNFGAARTHLYIAGRFDRAAVEAAVARSFGDWTRGPDALNAPPAAATKSRLILVDRPGAPQSTLLLGMPTLDPNKPRYLDVSIMNSLLGGTFASRITSNIREDKGYTYSPNSSISARFRTAYWAEAADVTTKDTGNAIKEIIKEIDRLRGEAPSAAELRAVQNYRAGVFVLQNSTRGALISQLAFIDLHGLSDDYLTRFVERVFAFQPAQISGAAHDFLNPGQMTLVVVGDLKTVRPQLEALPQLKPLL